jgi:undecaprenyl diphosphate synthase
LKEQAIPKHVGIIMDGNGRWAEMRGLPRSEGHKRGVERVTEITRAASVIGVKTLSLYAFSIENWSRPEDEISTLMKLLETFLVNQLQTIIELNIRFKVIGNRAKLPDHIRELIKHAERMTADNTGMVLYCALSYGGRDEIVRSVRKALDEGVEPEGLTEKVISSHMDTSGAPDPDLIIRTSGEQRISNFLLWQSAYSEFLFTSTLWPDFTKEEFLEALCQFRNRDRRFGKVGTGMIKCF